jgi:hypothetical protein
MYPQYPPHLPQKNCRGHIAVSLVFGTSIELRKLEVDKPAMSRIFMQTGRNRLQREVVLRAFSHREGANLAKQFF